MNNQIKVLLTINGIEGATLRSRGRMKIPFVIRRKDLYATKYKSKNGNDIIRKGVRKVRDFDVIPASKGIKLTYDAYEYMTSRETPEWYHRKDWARLSPIQRLELHLDRIRESNRGTSFTYSILED